MGNLIFEILYQLEENNYKKNGTDLTTLELKITTKEQNDICQSFLRYYVETRAKVDSFLI